MGKKIIEVKSFYGATIKDLTFIANKPDSNYTREVIQTVIQRYKDVTTSSIA